MNNKLKNALEWIVPILKRHNIPFQISGGLAANIYGAKRPVNDIDLDIPENKMEILLPDIKKYITFGPAHFKDERWDLKLITLNYNGQEIDIGGAYKVKIFDGKNKEWKLFPVNFKTTQTHIIFGIPVQISDPIDLIEYKKLLTGEHQKIDIKAVKKYILNRQ